MVDLLKRETQQAVVEALKPNGQHIGGLYFPMVQEATVDSIWDVVTPGDGLADIRAMDAESKLLEGKKFDRKSMEIADIAASRRLNRTDLQAYREAGEAGEVPTSLAGALRARAERKINEAIAQARAAVENRMEWLAINALQGEISYSDTVKNVKIVLDYGVPNDQKALSPSVAWSTIATSVPLTDLATWMKKVADATGVTPSEVIMSKTALFYMAQSASIRGMFQYTNPVISEADVTNVVKSKLGLNIRTYEARYVNSSGTLTRFLAENRLIMLPDVASMDGQYRFADMPYVPHPINGYQGSFYAWNEEKLDPYMYKVGVGITAFPRIFQPSTILTANLW